MWKRNLLILWIGTFFMMVGMNLIIPFLPLYVQDLGVKDEHQVEMWTGAIFAGSPLLSGLLAPVWGIFADRFGRKLMLIRSAVGMAIVMTLMGFVHSPAQLLILRLLMGLISGFIPTAVALQATETPKEHTGRALGILQTGGVTGGLIGPLLGGVLAEWLGIRNVFYFTGAVLAIASLVVIWGVHESNHYEKLTWKALFSKPADSGQKVDNRIRGLGVVPLYFTSFLIFFSIQSIEPIITVYVQSMHVKSHLETISGLVFASSGVGTVIAAPYLGRLGDKIGNKKVLLGSLIAMAVLYLPQAFANSPWMVIGFRFTCGLFVGGLIPSVNALLRKLSPAEIQGKIFGYNQMANAMGMVAGPLYGGVIASYFGIPTIFISTSIIFALNFLAVRGRMASSVNVQGQVIK
jgi:MFS transporter, DHA1 family, multidrug resistance protein